MKSQHQIDLLKWTVWPVKNRLSIMGLNQSREKKSTIAHITIVINNIHKNTTKKHSRWITDTSVDP